MPTTLTAADLPRHFGDAVPLRILRPHPFLRALSHTQRGRLTLITPQGEKRIFTGNEPGPDAVMAIYDRRAFDEGIARGEIGFADGYINGLWDSPDLLETIIFALLNADALEKVLRGRPWQMIAPKLRNWWNSNTTEGSRNNIMAHYDLGNDFYSLWLDEGMTYSCALFEGDMSRTLREAQAAKYDRILRTAGAAPGDHILDIGCGWGGFAEAAARRGMKVTGITLSPQQAEFARERMRRVGFADQVTIRITDYRDLEGQFDHIVSIGMFEHVGEQYWPVYFNTIKKLLKPGGTAMIQSITLDDDIYDRMRNHVGFVEHYIFPGGWLPSKKEFFKTTEKAGLHCHNIFSFGLDYAHTLTFWRERFEAQKKAILSMGYDEKFIRLWRFYLTSCTASFICGRTDVMQVKLTHTA